MTVYIKQLTLLAVVGLLAACADTPATNSAAGAGQQGAAAQQVAGADEEVRCKTLIKTGTRLGTRVCKTNREWDRESQDSADAITDIQRTSTHGPGPQGG